MVNLKDNIWIEGYDNQGDLGYGYFCLAADRSYDLKNILYQGKTSEILEELAKECVDKFSALLPILYWNYSTPYPHYYINCEFKTAKESIQSACDKEYCIIFKK